VRVFERCACWRRLPDRRGDEHSRVGRVALLVAIPAVLLLTHVWYKYRITQLGYQISEQTDRHERLVDEQRKLEIQAAVEGRSERLSEVARERFRLERVDPQQIITVDPATVDGGESLDETEHAALDSTADE